MPSNLINVVRGRFTILSVDYSKRNTPIAEVRCECGRISKKQLGNLRFQEGCCHECPFSKSIRGRTSTRRQRQATNFNGELLFSNEIAERVGVCAQTIQRRRKLGMQIDAPKRAMNAKAKRYRGKTTMEWAQELGISKQAFHHRLARYGAESDKVYEAKNG